MVEGMHLQVKQYEEWLQIMKDYSTVFSKGEKTSVSCAIDNVIEGTMQNKGVRAYIQIFNIMIYDINFKILHVF